MPTTDEIFMRRALQLAILGTGHVSPNPLVGCVIVHQGRVIGEGWHQRYGHAHAEVNAVNAIAPSDEPLLRESTVYVTLEPCSHLAKLREAGIAVRTGLLEVESRRMNRRFFTFIEKQRPYIVLKWAQTADGFVARRDYSSKWISGPLARRLAHRWRGEEAAVMVGTRTALHDNPRLNVRDWTGPDPLRVVLDKNLQLPASLHLFDQTQPTLCYNLHRDEAQDMVQYVRCNPDTGLLPQIVSDLHRRKVQSVLVEGGATLLQTFIDAHLWDEIRVFTAPQTFGTGILAPRFGGRLLEKTTVATDELTVFEAAPIPGPSPQGGRE
ncbi:MAG: dihydrofolate reductase family protein [Cytophagales bacterium]|nr:dihydrofolate reductase family protein [Cytophagales bacterium]